MLPAPSHAALPRAQARYARSVYLVALTRWGARLEAEIEALARELGLPVYDARLKLAGSPPIVVASGVDEARARDLLGWLRQRGHGAVACEAGSLPAADGTLVPRAFEFGSDSFVGIDAQGGRYPVAYDDLVAIVRAVWIHDAETTTATTEKKFSLGRALLTSGLVRSTRVETVKRATTTDREDVVYLFRGAGPDPMILQAQKLGYEGLGTHRGPTVRENLRVTVEWLRSHAPRAIYDQRLLEQKRWPTLQAVHRGAGKRVVESSNAEACGLAAFLLVHAHLQGQL